MFVPTPSKSSREGERHDSLSVKWAVTLYIVNRAMVFPAVTPGQDHDDGTPPETVLNMWGALR
jgi:hypothetical protein